jgi:acyl dehydratase
LKEKHVRTSNLAWEQVEEGQHLPELQIPITTRLIAKMVSGTRDISPLHHDKDAAHEGGYRDVFTNTMWYQGVIGRFATDWAGPEAFLRRLKFNMRKPNYQGDTVVVRGTITRKYTDRSMKLVDIDVTIVNNSTAEQSVIASLSLEMAPTPN